MSSLSRQKESATIADMKRGLRFAKNQIQSLKLKLDRSQDMLSKAQETIARFHERPRIVCLCGSSRFIETFAIVAWELERDCGYIVLGLHYLPPSYPNIMPDHMAEAEGVAEKMDALHKRKIDIADEILVLNVGGYIGDSTKSEVMYAIGAGKPVRWLEPDKKWKGQ